MKKWQGKKWPYYAEMQYLVEGIVATGAGAFNAATSPLKVNASDDTAARYIAL